MAQETIDLSTEEVEEEEEHVEEEIESEPPTVRSPPGLAKLIWAEHYYDGPT